ncbi:hypothetical protein NUW54_g14680 [Trametes sanguinea]|uniref:Uncharacterized protein n=1 Tax=Trametes sanguinea TaxID=158606 RepID=A0ACC1MCW8_9APHY|nr:hypothetical protein NUW54_g14680 [Trametes sanguinea]
MSPPPCRRLVLGFNERGDRGCVDEESLGQLRHALELLLRDPVWACTGMPSPDFYKASSKEDGDVACCECRRDRIEGQLQCPLPELLQKLETSRDVWHWPARDDEQERSKFLDVQRQSLKERRFRTIVLAFIERVDDDHSTLPGRTLPGRGLDGSN